MRSISIIFFLFFLCHNLAAQEMQPFYYHLSGQQGFPEMEIYRMVEDSEGFIWFASSIGTYRYDGRDFKLIRHKLQKGSSTFGISLDRYGGIWFNNAHGQLFRFYDQHLQIVHDFKTPALSFIEEIQQVKDHTYLISRDSLTVFSANEKLWQAPFTDKNKPISNIFSIDETNYIIRGSTLHEIQFNDVDGRRLNIDLPGPMARLIKYLDDTLLISKSENRSYTYSLEGDQLTEVEAFKELKDQPINYYKKIDHRHFLFTAAGVHIYEEEDGEGEVKYKDHLLKNYTVTDVLRDRFGNYWFSTLRNGVFITPSLQIEEFIYRTNQKVSISNLIQSWNNGISMIIDSDKIVSSDSHNGFREISINKLRNQKLFFDDRGSKLFLFNNNQLQKFNKQFQEESNLVITFPKSFKNAVNDKYAGAFYNQATLFDDDLNKISSIEKRSYDLIMQGNHFIVSHSDGLYVYDTSLKNEKKITCQTEGKSVIKFQRAGQQVYGLLNGVGLVQINENFDCEIITEIQNLDLSKIIDIEIQGSDMIILNNSQIYLYNLDDNSLEKHPSNYLIKRLGINELELSNNEIWASNGARLISISIDVEQPDNPYLPEIQFKKIQVDSIEHFDLNVEATTNSILSITPWINGFKAPDHYKFYFKKGNESKWNSIENGNNNVQFQGLNSGKNLFYFKAIDILTNQELSVKSVTIIAEGPVYSTWWFISLSLACIFAVTLFIFKLYINRRNRIWQKRLTLEEKNRRLVQLQLENLRSQMNPHFLFNALNSLQQHIVANERTEASKFLVKFSRLVRMYLDHSRREAITLNQELEALKLYLFLENTRFNHSLDYKIEIDQALNLDEIKVPSLFIQPYVENALLHGLLHKDGKKELKVRFSKIENILECRITDNGIGRDRAESMKEPLKHNSFATTANDSRVQLYNESKFANMAVEIQDLFDKQRNPAGTTVIIKIKIHD